MEDINSILSKVGLKCTKQRISVMQVLSDADAPLTVENIYDKVDGMSLSTVYRIAEKLCEKGIVSKHTIQDSDKFYYELINGEHLPHIDNFTVTGHKLEIYGYCDKCQKKLNTKGR